MRLNGVFATALCSSAALLGQVRAEESEDASTTTIAESSTTSVIEKPTFTVRVTMPKENSSLLDF